MMRFQQAMAIGAGMGFGGKVPPSADEILDEANAGDPLDWTEDYLSEPLEASDEE